MGSQNNYFEVIFFHISGKYPVTCNNDIPNSAKSHKITRNGHLREKYESKTSENLQFRSKPTHARTDIYLTKELFKITFLMFSCSIQRKIIIKQDLNAALYQRRNTYAKHNISHTKTIIIKHIIYDYVKKSFPCITFSWL